jgi:hypothetical protein
MRAKKRLTALQVEKLKVKGRYADGDGVYLVVDPAGNKRWEFLYAWAGKTRHMGLGPLLSVSLADAREAADEARRLVRKGVDPIANRRKVETVAPSFGVFADTLVTDIETQWRSEKHRSQWRRSLTVEAAGLRSKPVDQITTEDILAVLKPFWGSMPVSANRLRGRIERVLNAARARGHIDQDKANPAGVVRATAMRSGAK